MRVGLNNIDPKIGKQIAERLCSPVSKFLSDEIDWSPRRRRSHGGRSEHRVKDDDYDEDEQRGPRKRKPSSPEKYALILRKKRDDQTNRRGMITFFAPLLSACVLFATAYLLAPKFWIAELIVTGVLWMAGTGTGIWWTNLATQRRALNYELIEEELKAVTPLLTLTRAERAYCDILLMISAMEANLEARRTIRRTLAQVTELLEDSRRLEKRRLSLLPVLGTNPVKELEAEATKLQGKIAESTDDRTREAMQQSLELVKTRKENSSTIELALERLNAQQDALVHALATAQSALGRMQVVPSIQTEKATQEITETVTAMNQQTVAVEQAVQELIAVRG